MMTKQGVSLFCIAWLVISTTRLSAQDSIMLKPASEPLTADWFTKAKAEFGANKKMPASLEKEILFALSYYPELKNTKITFCFRSIFTSMKAVPSLGFLFRKKEKRHYYIVMNNRQCNGRCLHERITSTSFHGVIGHELGHIVDYSNRSNLGLMKLLIKYIGKKSRIETENRADMIAIDHGMGKELLEFTEFIFDDQCSPESYRKYKRKYYNTPQKFREIISRKQKEAYAGESGFKL